MMVESLKQHFHDISQPIIQHLIQASYQWNRLKIRQFLRTLNFKNESYKSIVNLFGQFVIYVKLGKKTLLVI